MEVNMASRARRLLGKRFGRWVVMASFPRGRGGWWVCRCRCGALNVVRTAALRSAQARTCNCWSPEHHGDSNPPAPEYTAWAQMWDRCCNSKNPKYRRYGKRGIRVSVRWRSYVQFVLDMGRRPSSKHSLDRIDNDGNYTLRNCRWATPTQQANNTSRTKRKNP